MGNKNRRIDGTEIHGEITDVVSEARLQASPKKTHGNRANATGACVQLTCHRSKEKEEESFDNSQIVYPVQKPFRYPIVSR